VIDWDKVKRNLVYLTYAEHVGDMNNVLPDLARALGLDEPEWDDEHECFYFPWSPREDDDD
jgi:hypothetical protein